MTREEAINLLDNLIGMVEDNQQNDYDEAFKMAIRSLKFWDVEVAPVVHGDWVKDEEESKEHIESIYICSACHNFEAWGETEKYNYCPNCGAKMDLR